MGDNLAHGEPIRRILVSKNIVALHCRSGRQHDVGMLGRRIPPGFMDNHGIGGLPSLQEPVEVRIVVEWIAADGIKQLDLREGDRLPETLHLLSWMQQHVRYPTNRHIGLDCIWPKRKRWLGHALDARRHHAVHRAEAYAEAASWQSYLAKHGGQRNHHPYRLLAMIRTLHRPAQIDHGAAGGHSPGKRSNLGCGNPGDALSPLRIARASAAPSQQIVLEVAVAFAIAGQEVAVV